MIAKILLLASVFTLGISSKWNCDVYYRFTKVCDRFDYDDKYCFEWDTSLCNVAKTTYNDYRCPTYLCVSLVKSDKV